MQPWLRGELDPTLVLGLGAYLLVVVALAVIENRWHR